MSFIYWWGYYLFKNNESPVNFTHFIVHRAYRLYLTASIKKYIYFSLKSTMVIALLKNLIISEQKLSSLIGVYIEQEVL